MSAAAGSLVERLGARMILLGTFHFQDRGLDRYKPQVAFDVFSERRQREIAEVVELLTAFRPTRIAVERTPLWQEETDRQYQACLRGAFELPGDEVYQLGFRLARRLGHSRVYCVNAWGRHYEPWGDLDAYAWEHGEARVFETFQHLTPPALTYAQEHSQEHLLSEWAPRFSVLLEHVDRLKVQLTLRELLLRTDAEQAILRSHGMYLVDWFKVGAGHEDPGVDWVTAWYNRNLRIFANLQRIPVSPDDRIVLIIGAGHLPILRHCAQTSPEYELVEVHQYLGLVPANEVRGSVPPSSTSDNA